MRILTINTWKNEGNYRGRIEALVAGILQLAPDVVCLQEAFSSVDGQNDTTASVASALGMTAAALPLRRKFRRHNNLMTESWSGLSILSHHPLEEQRSQELPTHPDDDERSLLACAIRLGKARLWVGNLHLCHLGYAGHTRMAQLALSLQRLHAWRDGAPAILCGDFNEALTAPGMKLALRASPHMVDAFAHDLQHAQKNTHVDALGNSLDVDHILYLERSGLEPTRSSVVLKPKRVDGAWFPSDHAGVCVDFELPSAPVTTAATTTALALSHRIDTQLS